MAQHQENKTFEADGTRPIESQEVEIVETFEEDGVRPIVKGFDYVTRNQTTEKDDSDNHESKLSLTSNTDSEVNEVLNIDSNALADSDKVEADKALPIDGERPINNSDTNVVETFEADGTRPIMANKYQVVDTLDIDGERPIASQQ